MGGSNMSQTGKLLQYINYRMRVTVADGRQIVGRFMAFDKHMNLVLGDAEEFRQLPPKKGVPDVDREVRRTLGLIILRGDEVEGMVVEGPPPEDEARMVKAAGLVPGPGVGRAAGRGMGMPGGMPGGMPPPGMPPPGMPPMGAAPGLAGPAPGFGAPAPGVMRPGMPGGMAPNFRPPPPGGR